MSKQWWAAFEVPEPSVVPTGAGRWARSVALGATGRAAAARSVVAEVVGDRRTDVAVVSLALATRASLTRQAGGHADARADDGAALAVLQRAEDQHDGWVRAARADALIGLAADNLGVGDFGASERLLRRAATDLADLPDTDDDWLVVGRPRLRLAWVRTELALYTGDGAAGELGERAVREARHAPSRRHRLKTELIAAATAAAAGRSDVAVAAAERVARACADDDLLPLQWAAHSMLAGLVRNGADGARAEALRGVLVERGMGFGPAPESVIADRYA
ncbi:hypothetical protein [Gordonia aichiensis]|uniref:hypothetical protein n=1 Tax=Gordonia aichiensis TaxID=36820 RepID=UPI003266B701